MSTNHAQKVTPGGVAAHFALCVSYKSRSTCSGPTCLQSVTMILSDYILAASASALLTFKVSPQKVMGSLWFQERAACYIGTPTPKDLREKVTQALVAECEEKHVQHAARLLEGVWLSWLDSARPFDLSWQNLMSILKFVLNAQIFTSCMCL